MVLSHHHRLRRCHLCNCAHLGVVADNDDVHENLVDNGCDDSNLFADDFDDDDNDPDGRQQCSCDLYLDCHRFRRRQLCHLVLEIRIEIVDSDIIMLLATRGELIVSAFKDELLTKPQSS
uniref:Uncharacterized protein n=1 Tax=Glossina pallidipes TaxID=7398 RepID=A0A1A9ZWZ0_GLOPL